MTLPSLANAVEVLQAVGAYLIGMVVQLFLTLGGAFSIASLLCALCVAVIFLGLQRRRANRELKFRVLVRALFPRYLLSSPSSKADVGFFMFNSFMFGMLFGWAILSHQMVSGLVIDGLSAKFGAMPPVACGEFTAACLLTLALFLAYEFGYWLDHYLSHRLPFLWEFHKVHHSAEVLSPLTNARVHPFDTLVFFNILALVMGTTDGAVNYLLGKPVQQFAVTNINVIVLFFTYLIGHLQHSHFWIAFTGPWGRLFLSPAHHQIHHSTNPIHFDKNLGSFLAVWDWMFGTLHIPARQREKLSFGLAPQAADQHTLTQGLVVPVYRASIVIARLVQGIPARVSQTMARLQRQPTGVPLQPVAGSGPPI